jgi:hypothetical protein
MFIDNMMKSDIRVIFEGSPVDANYIKAILEENGIPSLLKENLKGQLYPLYVNYGWIKPIKVFVEKKNENKAIDIINNIVNLGEND